MLVGLLTMCWAKVGCLGHERPERGKRVDCGPYSAPNSLSSVLQLLLVCSCVVLCALLTKGSKEDSPFVNSITKGPSLGERSPLQVASPDIAK